MSDQPSHDPYGQQQSYGQQQPYEQPSYPQQGQPAYGQPYPGGYQAPPTPRKPLDLAKLVSIAAWVVLGLFALSYLYFIASDNNGGDFGDRFFGGMSSLGEGLFYAGVLHGVSVWLGRNQREA